jgi:hypothetical protein
MSGQGSSKDRFTAEARRAQRGIFFFFSAERAEKKKRPHWLNVVKGRMVVGAKGSFCLVVNRIAAMEMGTRVSIYVRIAESFLLLSGVPAPLNPTLFKRGQRKAIKSIPSAVLASRR